MLFQRKKVLKSVANGNIIPLSEVEDEVFSTNMMGNGYAVKDHDGKIYSPINGTVEDIFPTLHAITLKSSKGFTVLIHMGLDTVDLKGEPFTIHIAKGEKIFENQLIAEMNLKILDDKNRNSVVMAVLPDIKEGNLVTQGIGRINDTAFKF